jgi:hypothetical protein
VERGLEEEAGRFGEPISVSRFHFGLNICEHCPASRK